MKKVLLITIFLLLQSFSSFGSPNGKGVLCYCIKCVGIMDKKVRGFFFENNNVYEYYYLFTNDKVDVTQTDDIFKYKLNSNTINWGNSSMGDYELNRKTLNFKWSTNNLTFIERKCELFDKIEFRKKLSEIKNIYQKSYNKSLKDNKL